MTSTSSQYSVFKNGIIRGLGIGLGFSISIATTSLLAAAAAMKIFSAGEVISASDLNRNFTISAPEGAVMAFNLSSCPEGWTPADGSGGTPDLRGRFIRGLNDFGSGSSSVDPDGTRSLRSIQSDGFQGHWHQGIQDGFAGQFSASRAYIMLGDTIVDTSITPVRRAVNDGVNGEPRIKSETRPVNIGLIFCVRKN